MAKRPSWLTTQYNISPEFALRQKQAVKFPYTVDRGTILLLSFKIKMATVKSAAANQQFATIA